jgi:hypothetical protein
MLVNESEMQWRSRELVVTVRCGPGSSERGHTYHKRDSEIGYVNVPGAPSQPASNDDTSVPAIVVASHE